MSIKYGIIDLVKNNIGRVSGKLLQPAISIVFYSKFFSPVISRGYPTKFFICS